MNRRQIYEHVNDERYSLDGQAFNAHRGRCGRTSAGKREIKLDIRPSGGPRICLQINENRTSKDTTLVKRVASDLCVIDRKLLDLRVALIADSFSCNDGCVVFWLNVGWEGLGQSRSISYGPSQGDRL